MGSFPRIVGGWKFLSGPEITNFACALFATSIKFFFGNNNGDACNCAFMTLGILADREIELNNDVNVRDYYTNRTARRKLFILTRSIAMDWVGSIVENWTHDQLCANNNYTSTRFDLSSYTHHATTTKHNGWLASVTNLRMQSRKAIQGPKPPTLPAVSRDQRRSYKRGVLFDTNAGQSPGRPYLLTYLLSLSLSAV